MAHCCLLAPHASSFPYDFTIEVWNQQVGPKTPTPIVAAPATMDTEMVQPNQSSAPTVLDGKQRSLQGSNGMADSTAGPSAVAVDMESSDVMAERDRVAGMTSFENECIVIKDLRKVYPAQVSLREYVYCAT